MIQVNVEAGKWLAHHFTLVRRPYFLAGALD
jgi:hypothetical protein